MSDIGDKFFFCRAHLWVVHTVYLLPSIGHTPPNWFYYIESSRPNKNSHLRPQIDPWPLQRRHCCTFCAPGGAALLASLLLRPGLRQRAGDRDQEQRRDHGGQRVDGHAGGRHGEQQPTVGGQHGWAGDLSLDQLRGGEFGGHI
jgi:hypothetical protein